jgi:hypothetical protein
MRFPRIAFGTPRKLPRAADLDGRVVVLDIAFAAEGTGTSFEKVTGKLIAGLGTRLAAWVDHHDHALHARFASDPRFLLTTKAAHGACPELVTQELVEKVGPVDTILCHGDFDGLASAAKWVRGGTEPYEGADADARAIDTRMGTPSPRAATIDRALRARPHDDALKGLVVRYLATGASDAMLFQEIDAAAEAVRAIEENARTLARRYDVRGDTAFCDVRGNSLTYDKTVLLLLGQEKARVALVHDETTITLAARFDSGIDLLKLLELQGGMPTRVSVPAARLDDVEQRLVRAGLAAR